MFVALKRPFIDWNKLLVLGFTVSAVSYCLMVSPIAWLTLPCLFVYRSGSHTLILLLCVDDIILTRSSISLLHCFIDILSRQLAMKDLGDLHYFLDLRVVCSSFGNFQMQQKYVHDLLHNFNFKLLNL